MPETKTTNQAPKDPRYATAMDEILALIKGRAPIIWVRTHEEARFVEDFTAQIAEPCKREMWLWSAYQGLIPADQSQSVERAAGNEKDTWNPQKALQAIAKKSKTGDNKGLVFIMRDFHTVLGEPVPRQIRDMYDHLIGNGKTLVITSPVLAHGPGGTKAGLPPTLEKQISVVNYELPNAEVIKARVTEVISHMSDSVKGKNKKTHLQYSVDQVHGFGRALQGLTLLEVDTSLSTSITHLNELNTQKLINDKRQIIRKSDILEFIDTPVGLSDVGGLDLAKHYLAKYKAAHSDEAKEFGVEPLKGILLTGVPGTGKSLLAKATGNIWEVPLLRLDVGKVMTGLVGGSEGKMREVINQAEAMSPCILWIDEVEKSLSGTKSSNFSDGGTLSRVFGTLLTAMQDGMHGVTVVATANDITALPPEFIRRFNEVFFVDLPGPEERWEILAIHLKKRDRDIANFSKQKKAILDVSRDYTGAEIEKAVKDAIAAAFYEAEDNLPKLTHAHLVEALKQTKPISKVMKEKITKIRDKARGQYRFSSTWAEQEAKSRGAKTASGKKLDANKILDDIPEVGSKTKKTAKAEKVKTNSRFADASEEAAEETEKGK